MPTCRFSLRSHRSEKMRSSRSSTRRTRYRQAHRSYVAIDRVLGEFVRAIGIDLRRHTPSHVRLNPPSKIGSTPSSCTIRARASIFATSDFPKRFLLVRPTCHRAGSSSITNTPSPEARLAAGQTRSRRVIDIEKRPASLPVFFLFETPPIVTFVHNRTIRQ